MFFRNLRNLAEDEGKALNIALERGVSHIYTRISPRQKVIARQELRCGTDVFLAYLDSFVGKKYTYRLDCREVLELPPTISLRDFIFAYSRASKTKKYLLRMAYKAILAGERPLFELEYYLKSVRGEPLHTRVNRIFEPYEEPISERRLNYNKRFKFRSSHSPITSERHVGIEVEFISNYSPDSTCYECEGDGELELSSDHNSYTVICCSCDGSGEIESNYNEYLDYVGEKIEDNRLPYCHLQEDGSLSQTGAEISILIGQSKLSKVLPILEKTIREAEGYVDTSCGLHVHLDCREYSEDEALNRAVRLGTFLPYLARIVAPSRLVNEYCQIGVSHTDGNGQSKYWAINTCSLEDQGTVEIRLHQGSTNAHRIESWVRLLQELFYSDGPDCMSFTDFLSYVPSSLQDYILERLNKFSPERVDEAKAFFDSRNDKQLTLDLEA